MCVLGPLPLTARPSVRSMGYQLFLGLFCLQTLNPQGQAWAACPSSDYNRILWSVSRGTGLLDGRVQALDLSLQTERSSHLPLQGKSWSLVLGISVSLHPSGL